MSKKKKKGPPPKKKFATNLSKTVLQYVQGKRYSPLTVNELIDQLAIPKQHEEAFREVLHQMISKGELKMQNGKFTLAEAPSFITGPISVHTKGFGFVRVEEGQDIFIPKHLTKDAVDGDIVEAEVNPHVSSKGPEGAVIAILKRSRTHLAATIVEKTNSHYTAYSLLLGPEKLILIQSKKKLKRGDRIISKVKNWKTEDDLIEAELDRYLGHISDPSIDVIAAVEEFELPDGFSKEALTEAETYGKEVSKEELKKRLDLTKWETVTIDPKTAKDFDDAISLTKDQKGHFHLGVHIADVAHYVKPGMYLDLESRNRCNSVYFPGEVVPMLPKTLSNELCSLKPEVVRLTQSVLAEFNSLGDLVHVKIERTAIESKKRFSYEEALEVLEGKKESPFSPLLERMVELCHLFKQKRKERGSIDFALHEDVIEVDAKGVPIKLNRVEYDITHQMIEEFMLKANELVATHLNNQGKTLIYRVHEEPSKDSFQDFYSIARTLGFHLPPNPTHKDIQKLFQDAKGSPFLDQLSISFIRSMKLAEYSPDNIGHYGLALEHYSHFTSPIRRYTDLIIQRLLFNEISSDENLESVATACSQRERVAMKAENSVTLLKKLRLAGAHFEENPNELYEASITKIKPFALFFEVAKFDIEATLHISEIGKDYFEYNPKTMTLQGRHTGKKYRVGEKIQVLLTEIDYIFQKSKWVLKTPSKKQS